MKLDDFRDIRVLAEQILTNPDSPLESRQIAREDLARAGGQTQELDARINELLADVDDQMSEEA